MNEIGSYVTALIAESLASMGSLESSLSALPTIGTVAGTATVETGTSLIKESDGTTLQVAGSLMTTFGTSVSLNAGPVYDATKVKLELTQAYVESMNEKELSDLIQKLEAKDIELASQDEKNQKIYRM